MSAIIAPSPDTIDEENMPSLQLNWEEEKILSEDIEAAQVERKLEIRKRIKDRYNYLNDKQVDFIGTLDESIDNSIPDVYFPRLRIDNFRNQLSCKDFLRLLRGPFITFIVTVSVALATVFYPDVAIFYPYVVTFITFVGSIPAFKEKYDDYYQKIVNGLDAVKKKVDPAFDKLEQKATNLVKLSRKKLDDFLVDVKEDLNEVRKAKVLIQQVNPDIPIPDVADLEGYLDDREKEIQRSVNTVRSSLDMEHYIPWVLQSRRNFRIAILTPVLVIMLVIQFFSTWRAELALEPAENEWEPVIVSVQTFVVAVVQIAFSYFLTRSKRIIHFINRKIKWLNDETNRSLKNTACDAFHSVLDLAMNHVRERVLDIVRHVRQIERIAVGVKDTAHDLKSNAVEATKAVVILEDAIQEFTQVETRAASTWLQSVTAFLRNIAHVIDDSTAGLIDCAGFVDSTEDAKQE